MVAALHPCQKRSSCERCRKHKLRCSRLENDEARCSRCVRLKFDCVAGQQRQIGRPARRADGGVRAPRDANASARPRRPADGSLDAELFELGDVDGWDALTPAAASEGAGVETGEGPILESLDMLEDGHFAWDDANPSVDAAFAAHPAAAADLSAEESALFWALRPLHRPSGLDSHDALVRLSQINLDLHARIALVETHPPDVGFCVLLEQKGGTSVEFALVAAQDFLRVLARLRTERLTSGAQRAAASSDAAQPASLGTFLCSDIPADASLPGTPSDALAPPPPPVVVPWPPLSQPLALVVTSVYVQIAALFELILRHLRLRLQTLGEDPLEPVDGLNFGALALTDAYMQGIVFVQIVGQLLQRLDWTLGLGDRDSGGVLSTQQRDTLWEQMGAGVKEDGRRRGVGIREGFDRVRAILVEASMC